ncbi:D-alanine--D-alanine ligase [bacterium]|nr:D-alanine--D-alanine ligase [bacterium]
MILSNKNNDIKKIAIVCGGTTSEREVSLNSSSSIKAALDTIGYEAVLLDWPESSVVDNSDELKKFDLVFIGYHGGPGESGLIQATLELAGIPYTGSAALACGISMDKIYSKRIFDQMEIPTPRWFAWEEKKAPSAKVVLNSSRLVFPIVVKTPNQGSTIGITIAKNSSELDVGIQAALAYEHRILFEEYIPGREVTSAILEGEQLPVVEIIPKDGFYDYKHKYTSGASEYVCPADISDEIAKRITDIGNRAFKALDLRHYGRVDFRLDGDMPYCLEVNSLPGMTSFSLVPKAAASVGITFTELLNRIINMAVG